MISWGNATSRVGQQGTPQAGLCGLTRGQRETCKNSYEVPSFMNTHVSLNWIFSVWLGYGELGAGWGPELS